MLEVKTILVHTNPAIQGVSSNMGFADQSSFGKFFKNNTDLSLKKFTQNSLDETFKMNKYIYHLNTAKKTKTGNYNDNIKTYIGRYIRFCYLTPMSLLQNNSPVLSNTLMLQIALFIYLGVVISIKLLLVMCQDL